MSRVRIAVTGVGMVTPCGLTRQASWDGLLSGQSAVRWLESREIPAGLATERKYFGAPVPWLGDAPGRLVAFARHAANEAVAQSGLHREQLRRAGCVIGTSKIDMPLFDHMARLSDEHLGFFPVAFPSAAVEAVADDWDCIGGTLCPVAACATGLVSIVTGANLIRYGHCPIVIAGSVDASLHAGLLASYQRLGVQAKPGDDPADCCRPFDRRRSGFAVGEGAACLILEDWDHAQRRGAVILAEWLGGRMASDPSGMTLVNDDGRTLVDVVTRLLQDHGLTPAAIDGVSLHATATKLNDRSEAAALRSLFQNVSQPVPAFGVKGAIGHLMGAAGAVETAASVLCLQQQTLLPTCNHREADGDCGVSLSARSRPIALRHLLKVSLGFGGHVVAGLLKRAP